MLDCKTCPLSVALLPVQAWQKCLGICARQCCLVRIVSEICAETKSAATLVKKRPVRMTVGTGVLALSTAESCRKGGQGAWLTDPGAGGLSG